MVGSFAIKPSGIVVLDEKQAKYFAVSILADVKVYIKEHHAEYRQWLIEQKVGEFI